MLYEHGKHEHDSRSSFSEEKHRYVAPQSNFRRSYLDWLKWDKEAKWTEYDKTERLSRLGIVGLTG